MTVSQLFAEWDGLTIDRKKEAVSNLVSYLLNDDPDDPGIRELMIHGMYLEQDDYFGTEGARL